MPLKSSVPGLVGFPEVKMIGASSVPLAERRPFTINVAAVVVLNFTNKTMQQGM
jgi:hypothetical protein